MRINVLRKLLDKNGLEAYLVSNLKNIYYLTGFMDIEGTELSLIVPLDGDPVLLTPLLSHTAACETAVNCVVEEVPRGIKLQDRVIERVKNLCIEAAGFDELPISTYLTLTRELKSTKLVQNQDIVWEMRRVKDEKEIYLIKKSAELTDIGARAGMEFVRAGVREYEVAAEIEYEMRRRGSEGVAFETVVASGPRSAHPHGSATSRIIKRGDSVVLDLGAVYHGYRCDITRTVIVGKPTAEQVEILKLLMEANKRGLEAIHGGVKARDVDEAARKIIEERGLGRYFIHGLGHGIGLDIHEPPRLSPDSEDVLVEGNVVTDEPGIYMSGFGARVEDTVLVHKRGGEKLTKTRYFEL